MRCFLSSASTAASWGWASSASSRAIDRRAQVHRIVRLRRAQQAELRDRLLGRVERLYAERDERASLLERCGTPIPCSMGSLASNTLVTRRADGFRATLIDWDHVGTGPVTDDLSTFMYRSRPGVPALDPHALPRGGGPAGLAVTGRLDPESAFRDRGMCPLRMQSRRCGARCLPERGVGISDDGGDR